MRGMKLAIRKFGGDSLSMSEVLPLCWERSQLQVAWEPSGYWVMKSSRENRLLWMMHLVEYILIFDFQRINNSLKVDLNGSTLLLIEVMKCL